MGECNEIGARIKALRIRQGMTQSELATKLFTTRELVNMWERGARDIKTGMIIALADTLQTSCDYLLRGIETNNIPISEDLGLSNKSINHLRYLREAAQQGEFPEQDELHAIDSLLGSVYGTILEEIHAYFATDFMRPLIMRDADAENEDDAFVESDEYVIAFKQNDLRPNSDTTSRHSFMEIDADVYENAFLSRITDKMKLLKFYKGDIPRN